MKITTNAKSLTSKEYQALFVSKSKRTNKFNNVKVEIEGKKFDSTKEGRVYSDLSWQKEQKIIFDFKCQVEFPLVEAVKGKIRNYQKKSYVADFVIYDEVGDIVEVIDVKPDKDKKQKNRLSRTAKYGLSIHLFYLKYGIEVTEK